MSQALLVCEISIIKTCLTLKCMRINVCKGDFLHWLISICLSTQLQTHGWWKWSTTELLRGSCPGARQSRSLATGVHMCSRSYPGGRRIPVTAQRKVFCILTKYHDEKQYKLKGLFMVFILLQIWKMPSTIYFDQAVKNLCHSIWPWELYAEILRRCISS